MNSSLCIVCIFLILTPHLTFSWPQILNKDTGPPATAENPEEDDVTVKILQQSLQLLNKWLVARTDKLLSKIVEVDSALHQTMHNNQQTNFYKFDAMTAAIGTLQHHLTECKQTQEEMTTQKEEVSTFAANVRILKEALAKMEQKVEAHNKTLSVHMISVQNMFKKLDEKIKQFDCLDQDLRSFKHQSIKDVAVMRTQLDQQELVLSKLMDGVVSANKKTNELQQKMQTNLDTMMKTLNMFKSQIEDHKSSSKGLVDDQSGIFKREMHTHRRRMGRQMSMVDVRLSRMVHYLNQTMHSNEETHKNALEQVKRAVETVVDELNIVKLEGKTVNEYRDKIVGELFSQQQEITKHGAMMNALKKDVDALLSYAVHGVPLPSKHSRPKLCRRV